MGKASEVYRRNRAAETLSADECFRSRQPPSDRERVPEGTLLAGIRSVSCAQVRRSSGMEAAGRNCGSMAADRGCVRGLMKNQNDRSRADRKGEDPEAGAQEAPASATGMFERPLAPLAHPGFDDPNAEFRAAASKEMPGSRAPAGANEPRSPVQASHPAANAAPAAGEKPGAGEFTRVFQAFTAEAIAPNAQAPDAVKEASSSSDARAGEFTRIFMPLPKDADTLSETPAVMGSRQDTGNPRPSETGEFTRLMRAADVVAKPAGAAGAPVVSPVQGSGPVRGISTPGANDAVSGTAGVTELFVAPSQRPAAWPVAGPTAPLPSPPRAGATPRKEAGTPPAGKATPPSEPGWAFSPAPSAFQGGLPHRESAGEGQSVGEFTQLFRALDRDRELSAAAPETDLSAPEAAPQMPRPGKLSDAGGGEFTQLMQSLSHERPGENRAGMPAAPATRAWPEPMPAQSAGPADDSASFTRILSTSAAREEAARGTKSAADAPAAKGDASASPVAAMPGMPQPMQAASLPRAASFGQLPAAPTPPVLPSPTPASAPQSKLQAYLPLLLIINAFALAVLIVLVVLALRRH